METHKLFFILVFYPIRNKENVLLCFFSFEPLMDRKKEVLLLNIRFSIRATAQTKILSRCIGKIVSSRPVPWVNYGKKNNIL